MWMLIERVCAVATASAAAAAAARPPGID